MTRDPVIYVVDDDEAVRDSLDLLLSSRGHMVKTFATAEDFLRSVEPDAAGVALIDVRMPGIDGLELQRRLSGYSLAVIIVTGHADVSMAVQAMKAGAADFLEKPYSDEAIMGCVARCLDSAVKPASAERGLIDSRLKRLSPREREVLDLLVAGKPNKIIAHALSISPRTVEIHRARVMEKMEAGSLSELVRQALVAQGTVPPH